MSEHAPPAQELEAESCWMLQPKPLRKARLVRIRRVSDFWVEFDVLWGGRDRQGAWSRSTWDRVIRYSARKAKP